MCVLRSSLYHDLIARSPHTHTQQDNFMMDTYTATIGVDFKVKTLHIDGQSIRLQIWDTGTSARPPAQW
jgi:GTPase SAR1 family protein